MSGSGPATSHKVDPPAERHMDDQRFERELKHKESLQKQADKGGSKEAEQREGERLYPPGSPLPPCPYLIPPVSPERSNSALATGVPDHSKQRAPSATYDAFMRMQTGQETRTIADKINDPNRVSWEQFRKDNADRLDIPGADRKKMAEYRAQLDAVREEALAKGRNRPKRKLGVSSSSESEAEGEGKKGNGVGPGGSGSDGGGDGDGGGRSSSKRKSSKRKKEKRSKKSGSSSTSSKKKHHHHKKRSKKSSKRRKDDDDSGGGTDSDAEEDSEETKKRRRKEKKSKKKNHAEKDTKGPDPRRLSDFLQESSGSDTG